MGLGWLFNPRGGMLDLRLIDPRGRLLGRRLIDARKIGCVWLLEWGVRPGGLGFVAQPAEIALDDQRLRFLFLVVRRQPFTTATGLSFATFFERPSS